MVNPAFTTMESCAVAEALAESVTLTVNPVVPSALGLPAITPPDDSVIPAGSPVLPLTDHVYPLPDPPEAFSVVEV
jgi:hypothetical protein